MNETKQKITTPQAVILTAIVAILITLITINMPWANESEAWKMASRYTARFAFFCFLPVFFIRPLMQAKPIEFFRKFLKRKRALGLVYASAQTIHAIVFTLAIMVFGVHTEISKIIGGGFGVAIMLAMAFTSNNQAIKTLTPPVWKTLHRTGLYVIWAIYFYSYIGGLNSKPLISAFGVLILSFGLVLRILVAFLQRAKPKPVI